ncbi:MAG TPA: fatty acyl-AMP ligase [Desulfobacterales bacterium]|nr:fatty acyl-AMP ligase [Desulfobacterales bacterium]
MLEATPTEQGLALRYGDFATLTEALEYAALGQTGYNFYTARGKLGYALAYAELRENAIAIARRLLGLNLPRSTKVAVVAETEPGFMRLFYGCHYAGMVPVPLPASIRLGGHKAYVDQLRRLLINCHAQVAVASTVFLPFLEEAAAGLGIRFLGTPDALLELPAAETPLQPSGPDELAYLQYTSGSTRFPRGVMITNRTVMNNLAHIIRNGAKIRPGDRAMSWLPFYHDMGLVGFVLSTMASQLSVDYLCTQDFGMRPRMWLSLISQNRATISFSPPFGYELCMQRLGEAPGSQFDLSSWRVAGIGAEPIRPEPQQRFAEMMAPSGFDKNAFLACYGMAECSLAVSFPPTGAGLQIDRVDPEALARCQRAIPLPETADTKAKVFVKCGAPFPDHEVEVRDPDGRPLPDRHVGELFVRGPSVMSGYFGENGLTREILSPDGWLNTGDLAYIADGSIVITGRQKDLIIINGRNIWPQDLEHIAESQPSVRMADASAFPVAGANGEDITVLVIECRETRPEKRAELRNQVRRQVRQELGIDCFIELVPRNTLPRTTSGKLARSEAKRDFLQRVADGKVALPELEDDIDRLPRKAVRAAAGRA